MENLKQKEYFQDTYLEPASRFPPSLWSRSQIPLDYSIRIDLTNNHCESLNKQLNSLFQGKLQTNQFVIILKNYEKDVRNRLT